MCAHLIASSFFCSPLLCCIFFYLQIYVWKMFFHTIKVTSMSINYHLLNDWFNECNYHKFKFKLWFFLPIMFPLLMKSTQKFIHLQCIKDIEWMTTKDLVGCISEEPVLSHLLFSFVIFIWPPFQHVESDGKFPLSWKRIRSCSQMLYGFWIKFFCVISTPKKPYHSIVGQY